VDTNIYYTFSDVHVEEFTDSNGKFKTDGSNPDAEWVKVEKATGLSININKTTKIKLVTVRENAIVGQELSEIAVYKLGIRPAAVTASPVSGTLNPGKVTLNAENGCEIYYTVDGSDPKAEGIRYSGAIPVYEDIKIRAVAKKDGIFSEISDFDYTVTPTAENTVSSNYPSGEYEGGINVSLTTDNPDDKIFYTVDGTTWNEYTGVIPVLKNTDLKAKIEGGTKEFEFSYVIKPKKPVFVPTSTYFTQADSVTVYCVETYKNELFTTDADAYTLYYTVDGSDPKTSSTAVATTGSSVDKAVIDVNKKTVIKAAVKSGDGEWSEVSEHTYDVISYKLAEPIPTLEPSHYTADKMVTQFFREQNGTDIYYTISYGDVFTADPVTTEVGDTKLYVPGTDIELTGRMIIKAVAVNKSLGLKSDVAVFEYIITPETPSLVSPYADKESGIYDEEITVKLYSTNPSDVISYKLNDGNWETYDSSNPLNIGDDSVLYIKTSDDNVVSYTYEFIPKAPVSTLPSGRYAKTPVSKMQIKLPDGYSKDDYYLYFTDGTTSQDVLAPTGETMVFDITESKSYKAYVVDKNTNKRSKNAVFYYIVDGENVVTGEIYTQNPYKVLSGDTKYISAHLLSESPYNEGIKLDTATAGAQIKYKYTYTREDNTTGGIDYQIYNKSNPIMVTSSMKNIIINAYLTDALGNLIPDTDVVFRYEFVKLLIPQFSLTDFKITNDYPGNQNILIYYTTDGSEPDSALSAKVLYTDGDVITLTGDTTVKTVYYKACGDRIGCSACGSGKPELCPDGVYGDVGTFVYTAPVYVPTPSGSGGGGGGSVLNKRKYTKDIFGNEHLTHISYIKGYPDGTVKADGNITREEVATILYRIKNKEYEEPFIVSGDVFPDVKSDRWSSTEIEYMANDGVILGYPDGEFKPQKNLTRAEFAALICRFINGKAVKSEAEFLDVEKTHWAYSSISALHEMKLVQGYEDGTFRAEKEITRAEVITVINKILGRKPLPEYVKSMDFNPFNDLMTDKWYYVDVLEATITHDYMLNSGGYEYLWENWK